MSHLKKDNILEFINRNIVYKIPETITVAGILYLIKDTIMGASCKSPKKSNMDDQRPRKLSLQEQIKGTGII